MKKLLSIAFIAAIALSGCSKSGNSSSSNGTMTANVGSATFTAVMCGEASSSGTIYYNITGTAANGSAISFSIPETSTGLLATGNYSIGSGTNAPLAYYISSGGAASVNAKSGTIVIATVNAGVNVTGTFNFVLTDNTTISNGNFNAKF